MVSEAKACEADTTTVKLSPPALPAPQPRFTTRGYLKTKTKMKVFRYSSYPEQTEESESAHNAQYKHIITND